MEHDRNAGDDIDTDDEINSVMLDLKGARLTHAYCPLC